MQCSLARSRCLGYGRSPPKNQHGRLARCAVMRCEVVGMNASAPVTVERGPFEMVPHWLLNSPTLSSHAIRIWLLLRQHGDETKTSFPGRARLAKLIGASRPTVSRAIQELHELGALCYRQRMTGSGDWGSNEYHLHWDRIESCGYFTGGLGSTQVDHPSTQVDHPSTQVDHPSTQVDHPSTQVDHPSTQVSHELRLTNSDCSNSDSSNVDPTNEVAHLTLVAESFDHAETSRSKTKDKDSPRERTTDRNRNRTPEGFDDFWEAYPRKVRKAAARESYARALRKTSAENLLAAARRYAATPGLEERFTAHAVTWLNQERWTDSLPEPVPEGWTHRRDGVRVDPSGRLWDADGFAL